MADEGASSSSNSIDEVEEKQQGISQAHLTPRFCSNTNDNCSAVTSTGHMGSSGQVFLLGKESSNAASNPFAIKTSAPTRSVADSTDSKETRPLLAPPTLKLGNAEAVAPKIVLRPSSLSMQVKLLNKHENVDVNVEGKENSSVESNVVKASRLSTCESNGKISKAELFASGISTSSSESASISSPPKPQSASSTFSVSGKSSDEQQSPKETFIFGQNLHERVLNYDAHSEQPSSPIDSHNLTFEEAALKKEELEKMEEQNQEEKLKKSLSESAKEYESKQVKRKFDEVTVITGEEEESNVLQINCKLFAFDKVSMNWQERGRGILRLNDKECQGNLHSRVVMRTHGSLRVVLNTKIWAGMSVEHPSKKTVRLTAYDPEGVKVFLVMAQPKDAEQLFHAVDWRVATLKSRDSKHRKTAASSADDDDSRPQVEEATSSSNLPATSGDEESSLDNTLHRRHSPPEEGGGADSSSETAFAPPPPPREDGAADSTEVHS